MISVARCFELYLEFKLSFGVHLVSGAVYCLIDCYYSCCCPSLPSRETVYRVDGFLALRCDFLQWQIALVRIFFLSRPRRLSTTKAIPLSLAWG